MKRLRQVILFAAVIFALLASAAAEVPQPGKNKVVVRGQQQDVYFYPAAGNGAHRKILFAPGDGGWRGFAITMAEKMAAAGYDVYGVDTRRYLQSFTGASVLQPGEIAADFRQMAQWAMQGSGQRVLFVGWSEGAGLGLVAAAAPGNRSVFDGAVAIGLPEYNILAWHWQDIAAELTKKMPNEPAFKSADYISGVAPLPLAVIASAQDEYVSPKTTRALFAAAGKPKRLTVIEGGDHKYSGKNGEFFTALQDSLNWIQQQLP
jgi:fermentation-respiration switch protein FrsA (DUF1100 family)